MPSRRLHAALLAAALAAAVAPASALGAASGGAGVPSVPSADVGSGSGSGSVDAGGAVAGRDEAGSEPRGTKSSPLTISSFALNGARFYEHGRPLRVDFELGGRGGPAKLKLTFVRGGTRVKVVDLGERAAGTRHSVSVPLDGVSGTVDVRISGRDARRRTVRRGTQAASSRSIDVRSHRFPVVGAHTFGGDGSRFGSDRDGGKRKHQGQDVSAPEGTPMVAARGGTVVFTGNQPSGAGIYVVIRGAGEGRDYVYMHLQEGSLTLRKGASARTGAVIGRVGNTGASSGAHLHFEIWQGAWQGGGTPLDPLPLLQRWDSWS